MDELKEVVVYLGNLFFSLSFFFLFRLFLISISKSFKVFVFELNQHILRLLRFFYQSLDEMGGVLHFLDHGHHTMSAAHVIFTEFVDDSDAIP